ncbi:MAG: amidohydrolase [Cyclobacteriaceae bacterium]
MKGKNKVSRREFNTQLAKGAIGLGALGTLSSYVPGFKDTPGSNTYIDIHHHIGNYLMTDVDKFSFDPILKWMDSFNVSKSIMLTSIQHPESYYAGRSTSIISNEEMLEMFAAISDRLIPFCVVHPDAYSSINEIVKVLRRFKDKGVRGFGELKPKNKEGDPRYMPINDPAMNRIYAACAKVDFPVLIHIDDSHAVDVPGLPGLEDVLKSFPEVNFLAHANGWWNSVSGDASSLKGYPKGKVTEGGAALRLLEEYPNLYGDLSANSGLNAVTRDPKFGVKFLNDFSDKLLFGTDALGNKGGEKHFDFYNNLDLSDLVKNKIFKENTRSLLNIA